MKSLNMLLSSKVTPIRGHKTVLLGTSGSTEYRFYGILQESEIPRKKNQSFEIIKFSFKFLLNEKSRKFMILQARFVFFKIFKIR